MHDSPDHSPVQSALNQAEAELQQLGSDLQFLVGAGGTVDVAGRRRTGDPLEPVRRVARLEGCDPLLWRLAPAGGDVTLGSPYRPGPAVPSTSPRCALGGEPIVRGAPLELYLRGRPVCARHARPIAPLLALIRDLLATGEHLLGAFAESATQLAGIDNSELREIVAGKLARELADRLVTRAGEWASVSQGDGSAAIDIED